jgi:hypothetical protein
VENGDGEVRLREENVAPRGRSYRQAAYLRAVLPGNDLELALAYDRVTENFISAFDHSGMPSGQLALFSSRLNCIHYTEVCGARVGKRS